MEHLLQQIEKWKAERKERCFNPYFYGTSTSTAKGDVSWCGRKRAVSILIFMEHLLQQRHL